jgi:PHD/YefM family antitoxin component YafN of YafNO toxin-antitoxin module
LNTVRFEKETVRVTKHGKTMGVVICEEEYEGYLQMKQELEAIRAVEVNPIDDEAQKDGSLEAQEIEVDGDLVEALPALSDIV